MQRYLRRIWPLVVVFTLACSARYFREDADREVDRILSERSEEVLGDLEQAVIHPRVITEEELEEVIVSAAADAAAGQAIDLEAALQIAVTQNRGYLREKESLYLSGLSLSLVRFNFGPLMNAAVNYLYDDAEDGLGRHTTGADFGISQILPTGGMLSFTSVMGASFAEGGEFVGENSYNSSARVRLVQPLLRGAGYEVSHEALTQAERNLVYDIRAFEIFRQIFSIGIARAFFDLVRQKETLVNEERRYEEAQFDTNQSEALRSVDRTTDQAVFLAQRREIVANDDLIAARAAYKRSVDDLKIRLGMETSTQIHIVDESPPFEPVRLDPESAVTAARYNRLDLQTAREQLEDAERQVRIAKDTLLPDLDLDLSYGQGGASGQLGHALPNDWSYTARVVLEIPLQRKAQRNVYRSSLIALDRQRRQFTLRLDELELQIRDQLRNLHSDEQRITLQEQQIRQEERAVAVTEIRYESGDAENRDLLDARQSLIDAQNELIRLKTNHFIGRLELLRELGLLFIDEKGMWR